MKTRSYHVSNFGSFRPAASTDSQGYITIHDSPRYASASDEQLAEWRESRVKAVSNAAATEQANRAVAKWRQNNG